MRPGRYLLWCIPPEAVVSRLRNSVCWLRSGIGSRSGRGRTRLLAAERCGPVTTEWSRTATEWLPAGESFDFANA